MWWSSRRAKTVFNSPIDTKTHQSNYSGNGQDSPSLIEVKRISLNTRWESIHITMIRSLVVLSKTFNWSEKRGTTKKLFPKALKQK